MRRPPRPSPREVPEMAVVPRPLSTDLPLALRPQCSQAAHAGSVIWLDGFYGRWGAYHERVRFVCVPRNGDRSHRFTVMMPARHPTPHLPHGGARCELCEHEYVRHEGPQTGGQYTFTLREIAEALVRCGRGESYRDIAESIRLGSSRYAELAKVPTRKRESSIA